MAICFNEVNRRERLRRAPMWARFRAAVQAAGVELAGPRVVADWFQLAVGGALAGANVPARTANANGAFAAVTPEAQLELVLSIAAILDDVSNPTLGAPLDRIADLVAPGAVPIGVAINDTDDDVPIDVLPASQVDGNGGVRQGRPLAAGEHRFFRVVGRLTDVRLLDVDRAPTREEVRTAQGWCEDHADLFDTSLPRIVQVIATGEPLDLVFEAHWANVVGRMANDGISADHPYVGGIIEEALKPFLNLSSSGSAGGTASAGLGGTRPSWIDISLPDLESQTDLDIVEDNLMAMQAIYFASTLEDLRFFQVMDKVQELFNLGVLPFGKGSAGDKIYAYWKRNFDRFTEVERQNLYARALGKPGGDVGMGSPNRQFHDLWFRFVSSVSEWRRQFAVDKLLRDQHPLALSGQQLRKSARDLASNLSLFGYGIAYFAATELQQQIRDIIAILSDPEVKAAYGARDMWQVIDQVATLELGGARNSVRHRTIANSGAIIIRWLADNSRELAQPSSRPLLRVEDLVPSDEVTMSTRGALDSPTNYDLIEACEQYLAVTGTTDSNVELYSQPTLGPDGTTKPIQIPGVAKDIFESVGVSPGDFGLN